MVFISKEINCEVKQIWSVIGKILGIGKNPLASKYGSSQKQLGSFGWWQKCNPMRKSQFLPSLKLGKCF